MNQNNNLYELPDQSYLKYGQGSCLITIVESTILQKFVPANRRQVVWAINSRLNFKPQGTLNCFYSISDPKLAQIDRPIDKF